METLFCDCPRHQHSQVVAESPLFHGHWHIVVVVGHVLFQLLKCEEENHGFTLIPLQ